MGETDDELSILSVPSDYDQLKSELLIMGYKESFELTSTPLVTKLLKDLLFCHERLERTIQNTNKVRQNAEFHKSQSSVLAEENKVLRMENQSLANTIQKSLEHNKLSDTQIVLERLREELSFEKHKTSTLRGRLQQVCAEKGVTIIENVMEESLPVSDNFLLLKKELEDVKLVNEVLNIENMKLSKLLETRYSTFCEVFSSMLVADVGDNASSRLLTTLLSEVKLIRTPREEKENTAARQEQATLEKKLQTEVLAKNYETLEGENEEFSAKIAALTSKIESMSEKFEELSKPVVGNQAVIEQIHELEKKNMDLILQNDELTKQNSQLSKNLDTMEQQVEGLRDMVLSEGTIQLKENLLMLENEIEQKNIFLQHEKRRNLALKEDIVNLQDKITTLEIEKLQMNERKSVRFKEDDVETMRLRVKLRNLNELNEDLKSKFGSMIAKYRAIEKYFQKVKEEKSKLLVLFKQTTEEASEIHGENEKLKYQLKKLSANMKQQDTSAKAVKKQASSFEKISKKLLLENRSKKRHIQKLEEEIKKKELLSRAMEKQDITLKDLISRENKHNLENINLNIQIDKLKNRVKVSENENSILNNLLSKERSTIKRLEKRIQKMRSGEIKEEIKTDKLRQINSMATGESSASEVFSRHNGISNILDENEGSVKLMNSDELEQQCKELEEMISEQSQILRDLER